MYIRCYKSRADDDIKEQLWNLIRQGSRGWQSDHRIYTLFWMPEQLATFAFLIDSGLEPYPKEDYIV